MEITLKNVHFSERFSEETNCFDAEVFVDGQKLLFVKNEGHGGNSHYVIHPKLYDKDGRLPESYRERLKEAEDYCKSLPSTEYMGLTLKSDLESVIDNLFEEWLKEKDQQKFDKKRDKECLKGLVIGNETSYSLLTWGKLTIAELLKHPKGKELIQGASKKALSEGKTIFNKNIPAEYIQ